MVEKRTVVIYPHLGDKSGTGHIKRMLPFFTDNRFESYLLHNDTDCAVSVAEKFNLDKERVLNFEEVEKNPIKIDFIILDNRDTDRYLYDRLSEIAPVLAIDEGAYPRAAAPYLIDILPNLTNTEPNYFNPGLLDLPVTDRTVQGPKNVLVTFGGQDPYCLTGKTVEALKDRFDLTVVIGPFFKKRDFGVKKIDNPAALKEIIHQYDLVITSFGITAYEAVSSKVPVVLYNPTDYHEKLGKKAGFYSTDDKFKISFRRAEKSLSKVDIGYKEELTDFVYKLHPPHMGCPVCGRKRNKVVNRYRYKTYYKCSHCSIDYLLSLKPDREYSSDYFESEYENQYGKTYLEDFDYIKSMGISRLHWIMKKVSGESSILDIGCAYGPFLAAAGERGLKPYGVDVSEGGIRYVNDTLGYNAVKSSFPISEKLPFPVPFSVVTMWYVIEHFKDLDKVLMQVNSLLEKGGVFAFSTPNAAGITGRRSLKYFEEISPDDHYTLLSPKSAVKVLKQYGFKVYKINVTGHHPERFGKWVKGKIIQRIILFISRLFKLGDTFEIYSIKERDL